MADNPCRYGRSEGGAIRIPIAIALLLMSGIIIVFMLQGLKRPDSSMLPEFTQFEPVAQQVIPGQATTVSTGIVSVYLPQEAAVPGSLSILPREPDLFPTAGDTTWTRPLVVEIEYADPGGTPYSQVNLQQPGEVCFRLTPAQWSHYSRHLSDYQVQYYADNQNPPRWVPLPSTTHPEQLQLCGRTQHFSVFALAIKGAVGIPNTGGTGTPSPSATLSPIMIPPTNTARPGEPPAATSTGMVLPPTRTGIPASTATSLPSDTPEPPPSDTPEPPTQPPTETATQPPTETATQPPTKTPKPPPASNTPKPPPPTHTPKPLPSDTPVPPTEPPIPTETTAAANLPKAAPTSGNIFVLLGLILLPGALLITRLK